MSAKSKSIFGKHAYIVLVAFLISVLIVRLSPDLRPLGEFDLDKPSSITSFLLNVALNTAIFLAPTLPAGLIFTKSVGALRGCTFIFVVAIYLNIFFFFLFPLVGKASALIAYILPFYILVKQHHWPMSPALLWAHYLVWDAPSIIWMYIFHFLGMRALTPFISEVTEDVYIGSMPMTGDAVLLKRANVGLVVNMCYESNGLLDEYKLHGIDQVRVSTADLQEPALEKIVVAIARMHEFKKQNPDKKMFIHCKGGRLRSCTMVLTYLMSTGLSPSDAFDVIQAKRNVAETMILSYHVVQAYDELLQHERSQSGKIR